MRNADKIFVEAGAENFYDNSGREKTKRTEKL
jgi:hypothetical protein